MCETLDDGSDSEHSLSDLGFDKLKIDNSSDVQSETPLDNHLPVEILPGLFLGSKVDSENLELLSKLGVRYILNVTPNIPNCFETNGLTYMQIPISDHWSQNLAAFFPQAIEFIGKYYSDVDVFRFYNLSRAVHNFKFINCNVILVFWQDNLLLRVWWIGNQQMISFWSQGQRRH